MWPDAIILVMEKVVMIRYKIDAFKELGDHGFNQARIQKALKWF